MQREREREGKVNEKNKAREKKKKKGWEEKRDRKHVPSLHNEINADVAR